MSLNVQGARHPPHKFSHYGPQYGFPYYSQKTAHREDTHYPNILLIFNACQPNDHTIYHKHN